MKVSELAKELNMTSKAVLDTLKSMKLKGKDADQELSSGVIFLVKGEIKRLASAPKQPAAKAAPAPEPAKVKEKEKEKEKEDDSKKALDMWDIPTFLRRKKK